MGERMAVYAHCLYWLRENSLFRSKIYAQIDKGLNEAVGSEDAVQERPWMRLRAKRSCKEPMLKERGDLIYGRGRRKERKHEAARYLYIRASASDPKAALLQRRKVRETLAGRRVPPCLRRTSRSRLIPVSVVLHATRSDSKEPSRRRSYKIDD
ncbi:hypothetical protein PENSPDRAFT_46115 [Peniophora sp. CONT]|nr:hypothetical protein PENSPDRAFT_46115 [Peniophora sp. CONT]